VANNKKSFRLPLFTEFFDSDNDFDKDPTKPFFDQLDVDVDILQGTAKKSR